MIKDDEIDRLAKEIDNLKRVNDTERKEHQVLREEINYFRDKCEIWASEGYITTKDGISLSQKRNCKLKIKIWTKHE